jgi:hypothetical protein
MIVRPPDCSADALQPLLTAQQHGLIVGPPTQTHRVSVNETVDPAPETVT